ncbi:MAG: CRISPR-associated protein Csx18 [Pleurocapsa sp.]
MYLSTRGAIIRNLATAVVNGAITLVLLLIAPLGLAAVIGNTFLVTVASFFVGTFADMVVDWLAISSVRQSKFTSSNSERELQLKNPSSSAIKKNRR